MRRLGIPVLFLFSSLQALTFAHAATVAPKVQLKAVPLPLSSVRLTGGPLKKAQDLDAALLATDTQIVLVQIVTPSGAVVRASPSAPTAPVLPVSSVTFSDRSGIPVTLNGDTDVRVSAQTVAGLGGRYAVLVGATGDASGLRDPNTNLTYAVKYLAGAYRAANGDHARAMHYYAAGYYDVAKRQRLAYASGRVLDNSGTPQPPQEPGAPRHRAANAHAQAPLQLIDIRQR